MGNESDSLSMKEAAAELGISFGAVRKAVEMGRLQAYRVGKSGTQVLINRAALETYRKQYVKAEGLTVQEIAERAGVTRDVARNALHELSLIMPVGYRFQRGNRSAVYSEADAERLVAYIKNRKRGVEISLLG